MDKTFSLVVPVVDGDGVIRGVELFPESPAEPPKYTAFGLDQMARTIKSWLDYDRGVRDSEGLTTEDGTHIMTLPVPYWPSHGQMEHWVKALDHAAEQIARVEAQDSRAATQGTGRTMTRNERIDAAVRHAAAPWALRRVLNNGAYQVWRDPFVAEVVRLIRFCFRHQMNTASCN